jgi:hypothetical protein
MDVRHLLAGGRTVRRPHADSLGPDKASYGGSYPDDRFHRLRGKLFRKIEEELDVWLRDDQHVSTAWPPGLSEVDESQGVVVIVHHARVDVPSDDFAEGTSCGAR